MSKHTNTLCVRCGGKSTGKWRLAKSLGVADEGYVCRKCCGKVEWLKKRVLKPKPDKSKRRCAGCGGKEKDDKWVSAKGLGLADDGWACSACQGKVYYHRNKKLKNNQVDHTHTKCLKCDGTTKPWNKASTLGLGSDKEYVCNPCAAKKRHSDNKEIRNATRRQRHHEDPGYRAKNHANCVAWRAKNPDRRTEIYWENRDHELATQKTYRVKIQKALQEDLGELNRIRKAKNEYSKDYYKRNIVKERLRGRIAASIRRMRIAKATPPWADMEAIKEFYINCPEGFDVDHVTPINHPYVCGLHVLGNLQYLDEKDNRLRKGNSFDFTHENEGWRTQPSKVSKHSLKPKETSLLELHKTFKDLGLEVTRSLGEDPVEPDFVLSFEGKTLVIYIDPLKRELRRDYKALREKWSAKNFMCKIFYLDEYLEKEHLIVSNIKSCFGWSQRIFARKCEIRSVLYRDAASFFETNHLMGAVKAKCLGLYFDNKLVACMSTKSERGVIHISRFCSLAGYTVVGGFSRLVNYVFENNEALEVLESFVDLRYGDGSSYQRSGWGFKGCGYSWKWTDGISTYHRLKCQAKMDERNLTQAEYAEELGWWRIHDAGQAKYRFEKSVVKSG